MPPETADIRSSFSWAAARRASLTAAVTRSPSISASSGVDDFGLDLHGLHFQLAGDRGLYRVSAGGGGVFLLLQLGGDGFHLLLHLLGLAGQLLEIGGAAASVTLGQSCFHRGSVLSG